MTCHSPIDRGCAPASEAGGKGSTYTCARHVNTDIVFPVMRELAGDQPPPSIEPASEAFDVRGLVIPRSNILV